MGFYTLSFLKSEVVQPQMNKIMDRIGANSLAPITNGDEAQAVREAREEISQPFILVGVNPVFRRRIYALGSSGLSSRRHL